MKRALSFVLAFIMVLSLVPVANAAETTLIESNGLTVTHGETMTWNYNLEELVSPAPAGGSITWQSSGSQIVATLTPGLYFQTGATLTFKNELTFPATLRFQYTFVHHDEEEDEEYQATILGLSGDSGAFEKELASGETYTITVISSFSEYADAVLTITNLSLSAGGDVTATFQPADNGSYTVDGEVITAETGKTAAAGTAYTLSATAASGYMFFGWYNGSEYLGYNAEATITVSQDTAIWPVFIKDTVAVFGVGAARFQSLTEANAYATNGAVKTIVLMNDGILSGEHTISAGNTLLIPYNDANSLHTEATSTAVQNGNLWVNQAWEEPTAYRTLTMAQGAKLTIEGSLNVGGRHSAGPFLTAGSPSGALGMIRMAEGSNITVANGGTLYCWGYIYGDGTVTVKNGGSVHENFQFTDFRGGNATLGIAQTFLVFPMSQYYVQNVEVAATFEYGATEYVWGSIFMQDKVFGTSVKFIGSDRSLCMFVPGENGTVTKTYDPKTDRLVIDVDGDGSINPMALELGGTAINTKTFVLPITNNMTININSGTTTLNQSLALLPGVELTIANGAVLKVNTGEVLTDPETDEPVLYTGGHNLIVYDLDQWKQGWVETEDFELVDTYYVFSGKRLQPVSYSVSGTYTRTEADLKDAVLDINGTLITDGFVYNTVNIEYDEEAEEEIFVGSTPIISSGKTGKVIMNNGAGPDFMTMQATQNDTEPVFVMLFMVSARLQNADGTYLETMGAESGAVFNYCADCCRWYAGEKNTHIVEITWIIDSKSVTQEVCIGTQPVYGIGTDPVKDGYEFIGWSNGNDNVPEFTSANLPVADAEAAYYACFQEKAQGLLGDVNLDGNVDTDDLTVLARHVGNIESIVDSQALKNADVNGDGNVDTDDLTKHARYVGNIITDWTQE